MQQDQPINGTGDTLVYDGGDASQAVFSGSARLWQGDTAVQGDTVTLFGRTGNLAGSGDVRSAMTLEQVNRETQARERVPAIATGREMEYDDVQRKMTYRARRGSTARWATFARARSSCIWRPITELERTEAYEEVLLRHTARTATGSRLSYFGRTIAMSCWARRSGRSMLNAARASARP